jgi:hypothetical protein
MYLQRPPNKSTGRTASILFYALCLLYVLSTATVVVDVVTNISLVSPIDAKPHLFQAITTIQTIVSSCCDFLAQCIFVCINHCTYHPFYYSPKSLKIYRCWIVWGQITCVVIVPSILAITYLGQSIDSHLISRFQFIASSYLASDKWRNINCRPNFGTSLGPWRPDDSNKFRPVHGCEYPGDGLDRVQDP